MLRTDMRERSGFTLVEICLAIAIAMMLLALAVPSIRAVFADQKLKTRVEEINEFVHQARMLSIGQRRSFVIVWGSGMLGVEPESPEDSDASREWPHLDLAEGESLEIERPAALEKNPPNEWMFWRGGTCEAAILRYAGPAGSWVARYDALTARPTLMEQQTR